MRRWLMSEYNKHELTSSPLAYDDSRFCRTNCVQVEGGDLSGLWPYKSARARSTWSSAHHGAGCFMKTYPLM